MTILEWIAHGALLFLLVVMVPFAWRLERQISALRREGSALEAGAAGIADATDAAEAALARIPRRPEPLDRAEAEARFEALLAGVWP